MTDRSARKTSFTTYKQTDWNSPKKSLWIIKNSLNLVTYNVCRESSLVSWIGAFPYYFRYWSGLLCQSSSGKEKRLWSIFCYESFKEGKDLQEETRVACQDRKRHPCLSHRLSIFGKALLLLPKREKTLLRSRVLSRRRALQPPLQNEEILGRPHKILRLPIGPGLGVPSF